MSTQSIKHKITSSGCTEAEAVMLEDIKSTVPLPQRSLGNGTDHNCRCIAVGLTNTAAATLANQCIEMPIRFFKLKQRFALFAETMSAKTHRLLRVISGRLGDKSQRIRGRFLKNIIVGLRFKLIALAERFMDLEQGLTERRLLFAYRQKLFCQIDQLLTGLPRSGKFFRLEQVFDAIGYLDRLIETSRGQRCINDNRLDGFSPSISHARFPRVETADCLSRDSDARDRS